MNLTYAWLHDTVRARFDADSAMEAFLPQALTPAALRAKGDDRYLSAMTHRIFRAGMKHSVADGKWPAFEEAFAGFIPEQMVKLDDAAIEKHMQNTAIIRHRPKLRTIARNAQFILDIRDEYGSFGNFLAEWPTSDIIGLWQFLGKHGAHLGGRSAAGFLRLAGKDTFLTTSHVVERLVLAGILTREPKTKAERQAMQDAFNQLQQQSGRPLCQLSAMLALTIQETDSSSNN